MVGNGWTTMPFGEVLCGKTRNGIYKKKNFHGSGVKIVNMGELFAHPRLCAIPMKRVQLTSAELSKSSLQPGDLLFARRSLVAEGAGKCCIVLEVDEPTTFESSIIRARPDSHKVDSLFLYYLFSSPQGRYLLGTILRHVAVAGITGSDLVQLEIPVPPLSEQRAIACILGALDDKIELNRRMNETLEAMARAIFKSWFVDFDPVRAKAEGQQPPGLAPHIADLFPDSFEDSELGKIPKGWRVTPLSEIVELISGGTPKRSESNYWGGDIPWFSVKDVPNEGNVFVLCTQEHITQAGVDNSAAKVLPVGTTIITARGTVGKVALVGVPMAMNQSCYGVRGRGGYGYCFNYFNLHRMVTTLRQHTHGSVFNTITRDTFSTILVAAPSVTVAVAYDELVSPLLERIKSNGFATLMLSSIRDTLLPKLISGELRVPDAERIVGRAL